MTYQGYAERIIVLFHKQRQRRTAEQHKQQRIFKEILDKLVCHRLFLRADELIGTVEAPSMVNVAAAMRQPNANIGV